MTHNPPQDLKSKWKQWSICFAKSFLPVLCLLTFQHLLYILNYIIIKDGYHSFESGHYHYDANTFDYHIPIVSPFIIVYGTCYLFWAIVPPFIYFYRGRKIFYRFILTSCIAYLVIFLIYIIFPVIQPQDLWLKYINNQLDGKHDVFSRIVEWMQGANIYTCSTPSNHVLISYMLFIGLRSKNDFKDKLTKNNIILAWCIFVWSLLVSASTFLLKQHYFIDWIPSIAIAELIWLFTNLTIKRMTSKKQNFLDVFFENNNSLLGISSEMNRGQLIRHHIKKSNHKIYWYILLYIVFIIIVVGLILANILSF